MSRPRLSLALSWNDAVRYLLDTNVCVDFLNGRFPRVAKKLLGLPPDAVGVSAIAVAELRYGASKSARPTENHRRLDLLLEDLRALEFDSAAGAAYGRLRAALEARGTPIGPHDMLIAAQAIAHDLVLVSADVAEFERVEGLQLEDWRG